jgi:hypothetical protein
MTVIPASRGKDVYTPASAALLTGLEGQLISGGVV